MEGRRWHAAGDGGDMSLVKEELGQGEWLGLTAEKNCHWLQFVAFEVEGETHLRHTCLSDA